jgi:hypothetical protein
MVQAIDPGPKDHWLDPCIGPGAFITPLRESGIPRKRIIAIDIEPSPGGEDRAATTVRGVDFFDWCASTQRRFTRIVANPPYVAIRKLDPELQKSVKFFGGDDLLSFSLRSNYWCAFLAACLRVLKPKGNLAFILPAAWDYAQYADDVRSNVLKHFHSVEVHRCFEPLFPGVREGCVVLIAKGYLMRPVKSVRIDHDTSMSLIGALTRKSHVSAKPYRKAPRIVCQSFVPFSDLYTISIGCVTGDAHYFLLTESDRMRNRLPQEAVRPVLSKARHLVAATMSKMEWKRLLKANERVWLFSPDKCARKYKAVREYLAHGEATCNLDAYKLRNRDPWYCVPGIKMGTGYLSGMTKLGPWLSFRTMRNLAATNTLYVITEKLRMSAEERAAWALSLLSTPSRNQVRELVRHYPDGLTKMEPHDLSGISLPPPSILKGACEEYDRAIQLLLTGHESAAIALADSRSEASC